MSYTLAKIGKKYFFEIFILSLLVFVTPTIIETSLPGYAPAIFTFIFNVIFEQDFSTRVLRPLLITVPAGLFVMFIALLAKRIFF